LYLVNLTPLAAIPNEPHPEAMTTSSMLSSFFLSAYLTDNLSVHPLREWKNRALDHYDFIGRFFIPRAK
jgi:hypothetical protein